MTHATVPDPGRAGPRRVAPGEISALLDQLRQLGPGSDPAVRLAFFDRKADLLTRIAADLDTDEAREVAAAARACADALRARGRGPREAVVVLRGSGRPGRQP